ncbi:universal stress protein [Cellulomonas endometrii]|uniref:universal stress protein n=1 Tax=Cellulomonas endometrii TaxID=3036301 RepID=UPI0024AE399F|nr:universal stress protein [Cellulomonas endometrii]
MSLRHILVGVDGRERSYRALAFSVGLAERESATLSVCYVRPFVHWTSVAVSSMSMFSWDARALADDASSDVAADVTAEVADVLTRTRVHGRLFLPTGDIVGELAGLARTQRADLVVIGRSRRLGGGRFSAARRLTNGFEHGLLIAS